MEVAPISRSFLDHKIRGKKERKGNKILDKNAMLLLLSDGAKPMTSLAEMNHTTPCFRKERITETISTTSLVFQYGNHVSVCWSDFSRSHIFTV